MEKAQARIMALKGRKSLASHNKSIDLVNKIIESNILASFKHIGIYYPIGGELDIRGLASYYSDKSFYLPITREEISFKPYSDRLTKGVFNTYEPVDGDIIARDLIDCFIIPCVCISKGNRRVGYGKGYYDRYLEGYKGMKLGICYKEYGSMDINTDSFDLILDYKFLG